MGEHLREFLPQGDKLTSKLGISSFGALSIPFVRKELSFSKKRKFYQLSRLLNERHHVDLIIGYKNKRKKCN